MSTLKLKLDQDWLVEEFFDSTHLMGIITRVKDYQLCWHLNNTLRFNFRANNELEIKLCQKKKTFYFSVFEFTEPTTAVSHYIYNNHSKAAFLLPELKNIDFLWLIKGDYYQEKEVKALIEQIRSVETIQLVTLFNQEEIKNKKDLIF